MFHFAKCLNRFCYFFLRDQFGESPAMTAARNDRWKIVEYLVRERSVITDTPNKFGQTLQYMATAWQAPDAVSKLLDVKS